MMLFLLKMASLWKQLTHMLCCALVKVEGAFFLYLRKGSYIIEVSETSRAQNSRLIH